MTKRSARAAAVQRSQSKVKVEALPLPQRAAPVTLVAALGTALVLATLASQALPWVMDV